MRYEQCSGAVVYTVRGGTVRYVIINAGERRAGFPKGHMEPGETEEQTALREIREEVGLSVRLIPGFRETESYCLPGKQRIQKNVTYFLAFYDNQKIHRQKDELSDARLMEYEQAMACLRFEGVRRILALANQFILESGSASKNQKE